MSDNHTAAQRHRNMVAIRSASTTPELKLRHSLWHLGFRYRINDKRLPGKPDVVLPKYRSVVFVHGCFWHGHEGCRDVSIPKTNTEFWLAKIRRNQQRDQEVWRKLEAKGWFVIIVWECQLKKAVLENTIKRVQDAILHNGESLRKTQDERRRARKEYLQERRARKEHEKEVLAEIKLS